MTEEKTISIEVEQITVETNLNVPSNYPELPLFVEKGWFDATMVEQKNESKVYRIEDDDTDAKLTFTRHWERETLSKGDDHHISNDSEVKNRSGEGDTYPLGDFVLDFTYGYENWTGMDWDLGSPKMRVRYAPHITDPKANVTIEETG